VARTNDGNLLQHFVECQSSEVLAASAPDLHLVCTHAMAPFEPGEHAVADDANRALVAVLQSASDPSAVPLRTAYARTRASLDSYPNTAELIVALRGAEHVSGILCEKDEIHASVLANRWATSQLAVRVGNWRTALADGRLDPPEQDRPWLFSMDPYTWLRDHEVNRANRGPRLCRADLELLRRLIGRYASRAAPGALTIPVYGLDEGHAGDFRRSTIRLADRLGLERTFLGLPAPAGERHVVALLSPTAGLPAQVAEAWAAFSGEVLPD